MTCNEIPGYADWPAFVRTRPLVSGDEWTDRAARLLGVPAPLEPPAPRTVRTGTVVHENVPVRTTELAWPVGFGPELHAYLLHPAAADPLRLPGLLAFHSHAGIKSVGALRMVAPETAEASEDQALPVGEDRPGSSPQQYRRSYAGGVAFATRAAARGLTVLAPDAFSWGSRRFPFDPVPDKLLPYADLLQRAGEPEATRYDTLAGIHEHMLAKFAGVLGTSYAGMIAHDDLSALSVLRRLCNGHLSAAGFSGGGGRTITTSALAGVDRAAVGGMMATFDSLVPDFVATHSWLLNTPGLARAIDLPDLAANRRDQHLLVVYGERDALFPLAGMRAADERLRRLFADSSGSYQGEFRDMGHEFGVPTQDLVLDHLLG